MFRSGLRNEQLIITKIKNTKRICKLTEKLNESKGIKNSD